MYKYYLVSTCSLYVYNTINTANKGWGGVNWTHFICRFVRIQCSRLMELVTSTFLMYGPFCHGALKHDISTLFATFFVWTSLQFILIYWRVDLTYQQLNMEKLSRLRRWNLRPKMLCLKNLCFYSIYINFVTISVHVIHKNVFKSNFIYRYGP